MLLAGCYDNDFRRECRMQRMSPEGHHWCIAAVFAGCN
jgi:hypothetical protein